MRARPPDKPGAAGHHQEMTWQRIDLGPDSFCELWEGFIAAGEEAGLMAALCVELPLEARTIRVFGREVLQPRLVAWVGDREAVYTYSGTRHEPLPWTPTLAMIRDRVVEATGERFNSVLCNLYRDGKDAMGMHADAEPELGPDPVIASLSLGAARRFMIRHRRGAERGKVDLKLGGGALLVMRGQTQRHFRHGIPREPAVTQPRLNLTFRRVQNRTTEEHGGTQEQNF
jgi:alkylated DNA repair dioxygenase AlkB